MLLNPRAAAGVASAASHGRSFTRARCWTVAQCWRRQCFALAPFLFLASGMASALLLCYLHNVFFCLASAVLSSTKCSVRFHFLKAVTEHGCALMRLVHLWGLLFSIIFSLSGFVVYCFYICRLWENFNICLSLITGRINESLCYRHGCASGIDLCKGRVSLAQVGLSSSLEQR